MTGSRHPAALLLLSALLAGPALGAASDGLAAQAIPDDIPDLPGESPADRAQERMLERHRALFSGFFLGGAMAAGPVPGSGVAYQGSVHVGYEFRSGDALFLEANGRSLPADPDRVVAGDDPGMVYVGAGYTLNGSRFTGAEYPSRGAVSAQLGVWAGDVAVTAVDVTPTYALIRRSGWVMTAGPRLGLARLGAGDRVAYEPFLGLAVGLRTYFLDRDRLELK